MNKKMKLWTTTALILILVGALVYTDLVSLTIVGNAEIEVHTYKDGSEVTATLQIHSTVGNVLLAEGETPAIVELSATTQSSTFYLSASYLGEVQVKTVTVSIDDSVVAGFDFTTVSPSDLDKISVELYSDSETGTSPSQGRRFTTAGSTLTFRAVSSEGYIFHHWTILYQDGSMETYTDNPLTLTINSDVTVTGYSVEGESNGQPSIPLTDNEKLAGLILLASGVMLLFFKGRKEIQ